MSHVHYKFQSSSEHDTITFDGLAISLFDLKEAILAKSKLGVSSDFKLQITNAQTNDGELIMRVFHVAPSSPSRG